MKSILENSQKNILVFVWDNSVAVTGDRKKCNMQGLGALVLWHFYSAEVKCLGYKSYSGTDITKHYNNTMKQTDLKQLRCVTYH